MANVAYIRVSTAQQITDRQRETLKNIAIDKWFEDKASGKNEDRPQLNAMLDYVRDGDHIYIASLDRLGRRVTGLLKLVDELRERGVTLHSIKENYVLGAAQSPIQTAFFQMMAVMAELERNLMLERQAEAYAVAKAKGKKIGRGESEHIAQIKDRVIAELAANERPMDIARWHKIARSSVYRIREQAIKDGKLPTKIRALAINK